MAFKIIEDRPTPPAVYNARIYTFAIVVSFGALLFGYDGAFWGTTYARASFQADFGIAEMTKAQKTNTSSNLTSVFLAGAFFGSLFSWPVMEYSGRRMILRLASIIFIVGALIMTVTSGNIAMMYAGRVITGFACGGLTSVIPTYVAESSPPPIRGQLTGFFEIAYQCGSLIGFWINYGINENISVTSSKSWRIPMAVQLIPGGLLAVGSIFVRESPAFLLKRGRNEQAYETLEYLRKLPRDDKYILEEIAFIQGRIEEELEMSHGQAGVKGYLLGALRELKLGHMRHRLVITFLMFLFQNWSGAGIINYYSPTLFAGLGITDVALYTGVYGLVKAIGSFIFFALIIDRSGRRIPWLISASTCALFLLYLSIFSKVANVKEPSESTHQGGIAAEVFVMLYALFWSFGGNGLPWIVSSEIFPMRLRSFTGAFASMSQWLVSFVGTEAFPHIVASKMGVWGAFLLYACCCFATLIFTFIWIPETKGIPIECMETLFSGPVRHAAWRQKKVYPPHGMPPVPVNLQRSQAVLRSDGKREVMQAEAEEDIKATTGTGHV